MSNIYNKENFGKLIEAIENFGPEWIDTRSDLAQEDWHTALTHRDPELLRMFGTNCWMRADLMDCLKMADDYKKENTTNKVANKVREDLKLEETTKKSFQKHNESKIQSILQFKNKKEIN